MKRCLLVLATLLALPAPALAFDHFESFGQPIFPPPPDDPMVEPEPPGGGGGRYFTGSLRDGYTCSVCHFGGVEPEEPLEITIVPDPFVDGYRAGQEYAITLTVAYSRNAANAPTGAYAGALELVDGTGRGAGTIEVEPTQCGDSPDIGAHVADLMDPPRQVAGLDVCALEQLRVTWTAPPVATGPVWLNAGSVWTGTGNQRPSEDYASVYARIIPPFGGVAESGRVDNACSTSAAPAQRPAPWLLALGLLAAALIRRRTKD